jgi:chemotaxis protein methyltransferase CheR
MMTDTLSYHDIDMFINYIKKYKGIDLDSYRRSFLSRRLNIRLKNVGISSLREYISFLKNNSKEFYKLLDNLSINVSEFFRDPEVSSQIYKECFPQLIKEKQIKKEKIIKCWSCGCSYGEEPYSLAILFNEYFRENKSPLSVIIWATDIDNEALDIARKGEYSKQSLRNVDYKLIDRYFDTLSPERYRIKDDVKKMVTFKRHDFLADPPLKNMDIIFFRNVRIYFSGSKSKEALYVIGDSLKEGGFLILGKVESILDFLRDVFKPLSLKNKIFRKIKKGGDYGA